MRHQCAIAVTAVAMAASGVAAPASAANYGLQVTDKDGNPLPDAVVMLHDVTSQGQEASGVISQGGQMYQPFVSSFDVGTEVAFTNTDNFRHHVYSFSKAKKFALSLFGGDTDMSVTFDKPGVVALGCNIHDNMMAFAFVTDAPRHGVTGDGGEVTFADLEATPAKVSVWYPGMNDAVMLSAAQIEAATVQLNVSPISQPEPEEE